MLVLLAKKIDFKCININLVKKPDWFVEQTWGQVPVLRTNGKTVMESLIAAEYLDQLKKECVLTPEDSFEAAESSLLVEKMSKLATFYPLMKAKKDTLEETKKERQEKFQILKDQFEILNKALEKRNSDGGTSCLPVMMARVNAGTYNQFKEKFFFGTKVGMADLMIWPFIERILCLDVMFPGEGLTIPAQLTNLLGWIEDMEKVPAVASYTLSPEIHAKFFQTYTGPSGPAYDMLLPAVPTTPAVQAWDVAHQALGAPEPKVSRDKITIYNMRFCPFAQRAILTCLHKKVPFDVVNIDLSNKPDWFVKNTWGTVPVIRYQGHFIMESLVCADFVDQNFPADRLHPSDPTEKALGRMLVKSYAKMIPPYYGCVRSRSNENKEEAVKDRAKFFGVMVEVFTEMNEELQRRGTTFFSGYEVGMTDLMVWPWMERLGVFSLRHPGEDLVVPPALTNLHTWLAAMKIEPSVAQYLLQPEQHDAFYAGYAKGEAAYDMLVK